MGWGQSTRGGGGQRSDTAAHNRTLDAADRGWTVAGCGEQRDSTGKSESMGKGHAVVLLGRQKGAKRFTTVVDRHIHFYVVHHAASSMYHAPVLRKSVPVGSRARIAHSAFLP